MLREAERSGRAHLESGETRTIGAIMVLDA